jgi:hypothetical protein
MGQEQPTAQEPYKPPIPTRLGVGVLTRSSTVAVERR